MRGLHRTWLWWSSGKDSAWALNILRAHRDVGVEALVTTIDSASGRVGLHGTARRLLSHQARAAGLELQLIELPWPASNETYETAVEEVLEDAARRGVECMAFGDLNLADIRAYREDLLDGSGLRPLFPLWEEDTRGLARHMLAGGIDAIVTCIDTRLLPREVLGRPWDQTFLDNLPEGVDPCGENGEFHTFVRFAPGFAHPVEPIPGEVVEVGDFATLELNTTPAEATSTPAGGD